MGPADLLLRLGAAALLGSLIGLERQRLDKSAGLRTHMLVSVGSALVMVVSAHGFDAVIQPGRVVLDPSRVAAQVVSGIGFLGAGTIVVRKLSVHGLTTAASIWAVAAIGLAAGAALSLAASAAAGLMLIILALIKPMEDRLLGRGHAERRTLELDVAGPFAIEAIEAAVRAAGVEVLRIRLRDGDDPDRRRIELTCGPASMAVVLSLAGRLKDVAGVRAVSAE